MKAGLPKESRWRTSHWGYLRRAARPRLNAPRKPARHERDPPSTPVQCLCRPDHRNHPPASASTPIEESCIAGTAGTGLARRVPHHPICVWRPSPRLPARSDSCGSSCGSLCELSRVVHPLAARDGGTSLYQPVPALRALRAHQLPASCRQLDKARPRHRGDHDAPRSPVLPGADLDRRSVRPGPA